MKRLCLSFTHPVDGSLCNIAENQPTWQNSIENGGSSSRAVDGGLATNFDDGSCIHTGNPPAIWAVDLGASADITYVEVLNRGGKRPRGTNECMNDTSRLLWLLYIDINVYLNVL